METKHEHDELAPTVTFGDGIPRTWDPSTESWTRLVMPTPAPPLRFPRIKGGGTPTELAARELFAHGDIDLAAEFLEMEVSL